MLKGYSWWPAIPSLSSYVLMYSENRFLVELYYQYVLRKCKKYLTMHKFLMV